MKQRLLALPVIGTALRVQQRYVRDAADPLAAAIAFFAFLSLFPLLLLAISVAGFVLEDPADQIALAEQLTEAIPGFQQTVEGEEDSEVAELLANVVAQRGTTGLIGLGVLLFSGLRVVNGAMIATRVVFRGPVLPGLKGRLRQLLALVALGLLALAGTAASSLAGIGLAWIPSQAAVLLSTGVSFVLDVVLFLGAYTLLAPSAVLSVRDRVPGALLAGAGWTGLKIFGATWVSTQVSNANALYGALGSVIALMLLFYLAGRFYLYGAELSAVRYESAHGPLVAPDEPENAEAAAEGDTEGVGTTRGGAAGRAATRSARETADADGPPPPPRLAHTGRPADPGPRAAAATITPATRARLAAADGGRRSGADGAGSGDIPATRTAPASAGAATAARSSGVATGVGSGPLTPTDAEDLAADTGGRDARTAVGFALAIGALAAGWRFLGGPDR